MQNDLINESKAIISKSLSQLTNKINHISSKNLESLEKNYSNSIDILDFINQAIIIIEENGKISFWNTGAEKLYGYNKEETIGLYLKDILYKDKTSLYDNSFLSVITTGFWTGEINKKNSSGENIFIESNWQLIKNYNEVYQSILIVNTDISWQKQVAAESFHNQRIESIGLLSSGIAHDLNNVFAPIMMSLELLGTKVNDEKSKNIIGNLKKSVRHGKELVEHVLTFSNGINNKNEIINISEIVKDSVKIIGELINKKIEITTNFKDDIWQVECDKTQINQLITNLMINANDAMPKGGFITINLENIVIDQTYSLIHPNAKPGPYVILTVGDTGTGIPSSVVNKIFDPFFTTKAIGKGTGLGLSTVLNIIENHKGFVMVETKESIGTEFKIYFPASINDNEKLFEKKEQDKIKGNGQTILLIDDDFIIREVGKEILEENNYKVITAQDGVEGITSYIQHQDKINLVIIDMIMPVMDGKQTIKAIYKLILMLKLSLPVEVKLKKIS